MAPSRGTSNRSPVDQLKLSASAPHWARNRPASSVTGVSPEFAMTKMDEEHHPECDVFVEDERAATLVVEILVTYKPSLWDRCQAVPYGSAQVGYALGQMAAGGQFPRATCVFVDGDQEAKVGCSALPGNDSPEGVVFANLEQKNWASLRARINRGFSEVADACKQAVTYTNQHEWVRLAADRLLLSTAETKCAKWRRDNVPVGLREKGFEAPVYFRVSVPIYFVVVRSPSFGVF
jgi:hypothetical protein